MMHDDENIQVSIRHEIHSFDSSSFQSDILFLKCSSFTFIRHHIYSTSINFSTRFRHKSNNNPVGHCSFAAALSSLTQKLSQQNENLL